MVSREKHQVPEVQNIQAESVSQSELHSSDREFCEGCRSGWQTGERQ